MLNTVSRLLFALLLMLPALAQAHDARPLFIQINETPGDTQHNHQYLLKMQVPPSVEAGNRPFMRVPDNCRHQTFGQVVQLNCAQPLNGQALEVNYPSHNPSISTLIRLSLLSGAHYQTLLPPGEQHWQVPVEPDTAAIIHEYTRMGVEHILVGWDHLLFLICLLLIAGTLKRTLITISGFTLSHSLTLVLTTLGVIQVPIAPVEAVIALSIVFLAAEILRGRQDTLAWRYPVTVSTLFGLIHGFGFAAVLQDIGLPQAELTTALLFFNIGVEIGQILFVVLVVAQLALLRQWQGFPLQRLQQILIFSTGSLAAFWTLERIAGF